MTPVSQGGRPTAGSSLHAAPRDATTDGGGGGSVVAELFDETGPRTGEPSDSVTVTFSVSWKPKSIGCVVIVETPTGIVNDSDRPLSLVTERVAASPLLSTSMVHVIRWASIVGVMLWMFAATSGP